MCVTPTQSSDKIIRRWVRSSNSQTKMKTILYIKARAKMQKRALHSHFVIKWRSGEVRKWENGEVESGEWRVASGLLGEGREERRWGRDEDG